MKLIASTFALSGAVLANLPEWFDQTTPSGRLQLSNPRFADGTYRGEHDIRERQGGRRSRMVTRKAADLPGPPSKAIDGVIGLDDQENIKEFTHSADRNPEFLVDLPKTAIVEEVIFYPRNTQLWPDHWGRYSGLTVSVGGVPCVAQQKLTSDVIPNHVHSGLKWKCDHLQGESISVKNNNWIHLTEIEATGYYIPEYFELDLSNARFADNKYWTTEEYHATLHGQYWELPALKAIDGEIPKESDQTIVDGFACSSSDNNPQFIVDYQEQTAVHRVVVYPRLAGVDFDKKWNLNGKYQNWVVKVGQNVCDPLNELDADTVANSYFTGLKWNCHGAVGESITIDNDDYIYLAEIKAFGTFVDPCDNHECKNDSDCVPNYEDRTYQCQCALNDFSRYHEENFNLWKHWTIGDYCETISVVTKDRTTYRAIQPFNVDTTKGTNNLEFEFKVRSVSDAKMVFCGSGILDVRVQSHEIEDKCVELVLGTSGNTQSIFRSVVDSNESPIADFVNEEAVLNGDDFVNFKITFYSDGQVRVYKEGELYLSNESSGVSWNASFDKIRQVGVSTATENQKRNDGGRLLVRNVGEHMGKWLFDVRTTNFRPQGVVAGTP